MAVSVDYSDDLSQAVFSIARGKEACARCGAKEGTVRHGKGVSPWARKQPIEGPYIKSQAQSGLLGRVLYAVAVKGPQGLAFRLPSQQEVHAAFEAESALDAALPGWEQSGVVPTEPLPSDSNYDRGHRLYGEYRWADMFSPRQLLALCTLVDVFRDVTQEVLQEVESTRALAILTYLGLAIDKAADYNSRHSKWDSTRTKVTNTFDRHGYSFKWSYAEFDGAESLGPWVMSQVSDAYRAITKLCASEESILSGRQPTPVEVTNGSAGSMDAIPDGAIDHICVDPPYEANVMYAECADYFYVWMKRTVGSLDGGLFRGELSNKDDEAVANLARFAKVGPNKKLLALQDYRRKMTTAFSEMHRVLRSDGVLTVMFTHKAAAAWDSLATSLIEAGFRITCSWPFHTESENSLHQAKKNAAQSTILLSCRKRAAEGEPVWWDDIKDEVRRTARQRAREFEAQGMRGVDLYIATFGPTLSILSENWPVLTSEADESGRPRPLRPEIALDLAREEVVALRKQGLLLGRDVQFDPATDWYLMAWDAFGAEQFPADEAIKLAMALGLDLEREVITEKRLIEKKGQDVILLEPAKRRRAGLVDPDNRVFTCWLDAAQTAMLLYLEDGSDACKRFLNDARLMNDSTFKACLQAMLNAIPRVKQRGEFIRKEAAALDSMRLAFFPDLELPMDPELALAGEQLGMLDDDLG